MVDDSDRADDHPWLSCSSLRRYASLARIAPQATTPAQGSLQGGDTDNSLAPARTIDGSVSVDPSALPSRPVAPLVSGARAWADQVERAAGSIGWPHSGQVPLTLPVRL